MESNYPEHDKMTQYGEDFKIAIEEFLEFIDNKGYEVKDKEGKPVTSEEMFYHFFGIDREAFDLETQQILTEIQDDPDMY